MRGRTKDLIKGAGALVGLIVAIGGIPWGLVALGQGVPASLPTWRPVRDWTASPITDSALIRIVGLLCWAVWALFVIALVVEIVGQLGHRGCRPRDGSQWRVRVPGLQRVAGVCVLTVMLVFPPRTPAVGHAGRTLPPTPISTILRPSGAVKGLVRATGWERYVVHRYDSPWSIAERHLGDGSRWRELRDAEGRPLWQPAGADHDDHWEDEPRSREQGVRARFIYPGEVLLVPSAHGNNGVAPPRPVAAPPASVPARPVAIASPDVVVASPPPPTSSPPVMSAIAGTDLPAAASHRAEVQVGVALLEAGVLSASVFGILEMLRRRQRQRRPFGRRICLPSGAVAQTELDIRMGQRPELADRIQLAVHNLLAVTTASGRTLPAILGAVVDDSAVELLLAEPIRPPPPWEPAAGGFGWRVADDRLDRSAPSCSEPLPALAPIGKAVASGADVLINLEAAGVLGITGDPHRVSGMIRSMAASLAGLPWAKAVNLILVGFGDELLAAPQARMVPSLGPVVAELKSTADVMDELLARHQCPTIWAARTMGLAGDGWPPTVVLCADPPLDADLAELTSLAGPGRGVVAVIPLAADVGGGWTLDADVVPMPIGPLRMAVDPTILSGADLSALGRLLDVAGNDAGANIDDPPYERLQLSAERPTATPFPPAELDLRQTAVLIRVLGSVELEGAAEFKRAKSRELAVYLAMHPSGVGESELDEALWPSERGRVVPPSTRDSTVSVARTALGGPDRLLPAQGQGREKRYQVGEEVGSDFDLFCRWYRHGRATKSIDSLRAALGLVRGRPFEGVLSGRNYTWVHTEGHARHIESEVGDAADLAATWLLRAGQPLEARWAARQGLAADPLCERLWIRLMEAADDLGESQEIERLMDELDVVLELGGDFSGLHPNTLAAYDRYRRGRGPRRQ